MIKPYYIIPLLIEQPTWGGDYIAAFKNITDPEIRSKKIGQAYELEANTFLTSETGTLPPYALATATDLAHPQWYGRTENTISLQTLIDQSPVEVLGQKALSKNGPTMKTLIKFTQAKNNSYQVHVKPGQEFNHWQAKPESWYYFEPGLATLGLNSAADPAEYQRRCQDIHTYAQSLSQEVKSGAMELATARQQLQAFIDQDHPRRFVNTVEIEKYQVVDLSGGGLHHSWEVSPSLPEGNRLYEVQVDVKDDFCTLRSFDQGNIKDDGSVRNLSIEDYFQALDVNPAYNQPQQYLQATQTTTDDGATITTLFDNHYYSTTAITFTGEYRGSQTQLNDSFHHLFVQEGQIQVVTEAGTAAVNKGWSVFIPAGLQTYQLVSSTEAVVLKTTV